MDDTHFLRCRAGCLTQRGVTLLELMVAVAVLALVITAAPALDDMVERAAGRSARGTLTTLLASARYESISRLQRVTLCRAGPTAACSGTQILGTTDWQAAVLFVDVDHDRRYDAADDELIRYVEFQPALSISWNRGDSLSYQPDGSVTGNSNGRFNLSSGGSSNYCDLVISLNGRVREACN